MQEQATDLRIMVKAQRLRGDYLSTNGSILDLDTLSILPPVRGLVICFAQSQDRYKKYLALLIFSCYLLLTYLDTFLRS
jgi:hypothetical protein